MEVDCKDERYKWLSLTGHSERMAGGNITFTAGLPPNVWIDIPPNTSGAGIQEFICSHK
jgi:hypothetical protein